MAEHLRYAGLDAQAQERVLIGMVEADPLLMSLLRGFATLDLPDAIVTSGVVYNTVWNRLTGRPAQFGIKDADLAYFDDTDLSYDAEDRVIARAQRQFANSAVPVELRNQARVHLWVGEKFGIDYPPLRSSADMLNYFSTKAYAVAVRLKGGVVEVMAPFGLDDLFAFRLRPNPVLPNRDTHEAKAARAMACWPELVFEPWPD